MKKFLAAMLVASFGAGLVAQNLVYDYKASIKRIDAQFKVKTVSRVKFISTQYAVVSDTISGYVALPVCVACDIDGVDTSMEADVYKGVAYLTRKGDKYSKKAGLKYVYKTDVEANAAIFGAYLQVTSAAGASMEPLANVKAANKAWMWLDYSISEDALQTLDSTYVIKNAMSEDLNYGFLGLDNTDVGDVYNTGFGTAKVISWYEAADLGWCDSDTPEEGSCQYVNSITGTLVGYPTYNGPCDVTPMWDVCYVEGMGIVNNAVISGTWTLKYNAKLSGASDVEAAILAKFKVAAEDVIDLTVDEGPAR